MIAVYFEDYHAAWIAALCGAVMLVLANPERLAEISLGPLRARMQEKIAEAVATVEQLREIAATMANVILSDLMAGQFIWGMTSAKRIELHDQLICDLKKIGVSQSQIDIAETEWAKGMGVLYHNKLRKMLDKNLAGSGLNEADIGKEFNSLARKDTRSASLPDDYEAFFKKYGLLTSDTTTWIADYRHFLKTKEVRRTNEFED
jgi:hypothetical protein